MYFYFIRLSYLTVTLWHWHCDTDTVTLALWHWQCDTVTLAMWHCDTGTVILWHWHCDTGTVILTLWHWHCDTVTLTLWHWHCDTVTLTLWHWHCDTDTVTLTLFTKWKVPNTNYECQELYFSSLEFGPQNSVQTKCQFVDCKTSWLTASANLSLPDRPKLQLYRAF